jgi:Fic family protein
MGYTPKYTITSRLAGLLERIAELRTKVELSPISIQWMPRLERDAFARLAHTSTAIEGNPLTLRDVEILSQGGDLPMVQRRFKNEVLNYLAALRYITDHSGKRTLTVKDVLRLHGIVGKDALEREPIGEFRDYQVVIRQHRPPKHQDVPRLVRCPPSYPQRSCTTSSSIFTPSATGMAGWGGFLPRGSCTAGRSTPIISFP